MTALHDRNASPLRTAGTLTGAPLVLLVILRTAIGWHFLYEGLAKLFVAGWTAEGYLAIAKGALGGVFRWMAANPDILRAVDFLNVWGLVLIGLGLMLGALSRTAGACGAGLILLYWLANPPLVGMDFGITTEGNYLVVDKNLVEFFALCVLAAIPTGRAWGLDRFVAAWRARGVTDAAPAVTHDDTAPPVKAAPPQRLDRRALLKGLVGVPALGVFVVFVLQKLGWESWEEKNVTDRMDAVSQATIRTFDFSDLRDLKGRIPHTKIGNVELSRVILGGNLIGGWAHARDLIYVSKLVKAYHHRDKVFETFLRAEKCGVNAILTNPMLCSYINEYWKRGIGKIQFISDCGGANLLERVQASIDNGAAMCYIQGETADRLVVQGDFDLIAKALDLIRANGLPAGIGAHYLQTCTACVEHGLIPDYWMKTFHHRRYWSANAATERDNVFCRLPGQTAAFMRERPEPWIAFKVLAAGAIEPYDGFRYAFENGADLICVGMYDFQIVDDVNTALNVLSADLRRARPWIV